MGRTKQFQGISTLGDAMYLGPDKCILGFLNFDYTLNVVLFMGSDASIAQDHSLIVLLVYCLFHGIGLVVNWKT